MATAVKKRTFVHTDGIPIEWWVERLPQPFTEWFADHLDGTDYTLMGQQYYPSLPSVVCAIANAVARNCKDSDPERRQFAHDITMVMSSCKRYVTSKLNVETIESWLEQKD